MLTEQLHPAAGRTTLWEAAAVEDDTASLKQETCWRIFFIFASSSQMPMKFLDQKTFLHPSESLWPPMGKTLTQWCLGPPPEWMSPRPQSAEIFLQRLIFPAEVLLSICMIIIWLTNVEQELVKVSHLQKVIEDQLRLIQSNYSSTAKCPASTTDEWKIITRWSGSDVPTRSGLILTHILQQ